MSLTSMALRIAAVQALKAGGTLVGSNVLDSQIAAIDHTADGKLSSDQEHPFIAVYSDAARAMDLGSTGLRSNGQIELLFNFGVSMTMARTDKENGASVVSGLPATDPHFEALLDMISLQIARVLVDPDNAWAQVFGGFVTSYLVKEQARSRSNVDRARQAAGQIKLTVAAFADPIHGQPLAEGGPWAAFMQLAETDGLSQLALFQAALGDASIGPYAEFERLTGVTSSDAKSLLLYSYGGVPEAIIITEASGVVDLG